MGSEVYNRRFGIEFEFSMPIARDYGTWSTNRTNAFRQLLQDNEMGDFNIGHDGSEWEVKTPILSGSYGLRRVKNFLNLILDHGARVTEADGLHIHHDAPEFVNNRPLILNLVENWYRNQNSIIEMVHNRRNGRGACPRYSWSDLENVRRGNYRYLGRKNLNINSLTRHGTIEVRLHEGTLDYEEVFSWLRFGQSFIAKALDEFDGSIPILGSPNEVMKRINISRNAARFMAKKMKKYYAGNDRPVWA